MKRTLLTILSVLLILNFIFCQTTGTIKVRKLTRDFMETNLTHCNVLYAGIGNPVTILDKSYPLKQVMLTIDNGEVLNTKGLIVIKAGKPGKAVVDIFEIKWENNGIDSSFAYIASQQFQVVRIPAPKVKVAGKSHGEIINKSFLLENGSIALVVEECELSLQYEVVGFDVITRTRGRVLGCSSKSHMLSKDQKYLIKKVKKGGSIAFDNIEVKMPDGKTVVLDPVVINLK